MDMQVKVITAEKLVENLAHWAMLKDAQKIHLLWAGDYIDGIAQVAPDRYAIQYGGELKPDYVTGDTLIQIEWLPVTAPDFREEMMQLINKHSKENGSNTPDLILASYLLDCLTAFDRAVQDREAWYGRPPAAPFEPVDASIKATV
jgi:hypothetical protein